MTKIEKVILESLLAQSLCLENILSIINVNNREENSDWLYRRSMMEQIEKAQNSIRHLLQDEEEFGTVSA